VPGTKTEHNLSFIIYCVQVLEQLQKLPWQMFFSLVLWWNLRFVHPLQIDVVTAMFWHSWLDSKISVEDGAA